MVFCSKKNFLKQYPDGTEWQRLFREGKYRDPSREKKKFGYS